MKTSIVLTSINTPTPAVRSIAEECQLRKQRFIVIGDVTTPEPYAVDGCEYWSVEGQRRAGYSFAMACPTRSYARKNIGYLLAMSGGSEVIIETDDDNFPTQGFWDARSLRHGARLSYMDGWVNAYQFFTEVKVWPRGFPLDSVSAPGPWFELKANACLPCPIQQGLADQNPDVDAVYRLVGKLPITFRRDLKLLLGRGSWCPFNSQNTTWFPPAFPLMYLPATCSIRMTDIWRGFVAQRIGWENGWGIMFHSPTVYQDRNPHDLMSDFCDEVPGYLHNRAIAAGLDGLSLVPGVENIGRNMTACYELLVDMRMVDQAELRLLAAWLSDIEEIRC